MAWHRQMTKVKEAFKKMDYETALEGERETLEWITNHKGQFGHFIGGKFTKPKNLFKTINPFKDALSPLTTFLTTL